MRKRKRFIIRWASSKFTSLQSIILATILLQMGLLLGSSHSLLLLMETNCLSGTPSCNCSWKGGKFVADCSYQNLDQVPKNDYFDYLVANAGNNQMPTLNRDVQQLGLASNNITTLKKGEFYKKKFRNLQKIYLNSNRLLRIHSSAFYKMTGLIELDLSENQISSLVNDEQQQQIIDHSNSEDIGDIGGDQAKRTGGKEEEEAPPGTSNSSTGTVIGTGLGRSFLQDLSQLRHLNLASNQLNRIEKFTFSPLTQLRQLILSKNKISFIDKRSFDGLNLLNILYLDGNKLSHLDGELLLRLPQLHAIRLAGSNPWRCDCKLRKLVRNLMPRSLDRGAQNLQQTLLIAATIRSRHQEAMDGPDQSSGEELQRANILQDEPSCEPSALTVIPGGQRIIARPVRQDRVVQTMDSSIVRASFENNNSYNNNKANDDDDSGGGSVGQLLTNHNKMEGSQNLATKRLWKSMKLTEFECPPKLAGQFMVQAPIQTLTPTTTINRNHLELLVPVAEYWTTLQHQAAKNIELQSEPNRWASGASLDGGQVMNDKSQPVDGAGTQQLPGAIVYRQHYLVGEPIELTCAFTLTDELDLEQVQVEWWQVVNHQHHQGRKSSLLWRSSGSSSQPSNMRSTANGGSGPAIAASDKPKAASQQQLVAAAAPSWNSPSNVSKQDYAIIDYVTRANGSLKQPDGGGGQVMDSLEIDGVDQQTMATTTVIRVSHLVMQDSVSSNHQEPLRNERRRHPRDGTQQQQQQEKLFLCRITNQAGHLDVLYLVNIDSANKEAQLESRRRHNLRRRLLETEATFAPHWLPLAAGGWPLERAQTALAGALAANGTMDRAGALFIPLHLPECLVSKWPPFKADDRENLTSAATPGSVARSLGGASQSSGDHQRPAIRHTNATTATTTNSVTHASITNSTLTLRVKGKPPPGDETPQTANDPEHRRSSSHTAPGSSSRGPSLELVALSLIGRYTSNRRSLLVGDNNSDDDDELLHRPHNWIATDEHLTGNSGLYGSTIEQNNSFRSLVRSLYTKFLDRWVQMAIGEAPLLLGICAGLLAGCLMTTLIVVRMRCANHHRVRSTGCNNNRKSHAIEIDPSAATGAAEASDDLKDHDDDDHVGEGSTPELGVTKSMGTIGNKPASAGGSSSSTTNGSQRKLIRSPFPVSGEARHNPSQLNPEELAGQYDRFLDSSCQSEEGDMSGAVDADLDSLASHTYNPKLKPLPLKSYLSLRPNWRQSHGGSGNISGNGASIRANERRLIVLGAQQQEMQGLPVSESPYSSEAVLQEEPILIASTMPTRQNSDLNDGRCDHHNRWAMSSCELEDSCSSSVVMNNNQQQFQMQQFFTLTSQQQQAHPIQKMLSTDPCHAEQDSLLVPYLNTGDCGLISHISGQINNLPYANYNTYQRQSQPPMLKRSTGVHRQAVNLQHQQQPASNSSMASPLPSTNSSLTMYPNQNHQYYVRDSSRSEPSEDTGSSQNPNVVYLEDALQLLQSSMKDCVLLDNNEMGTNQRL